MTENSERAISEVAGEIASEIHDGALLGLGSGSTAAKVLHYLARALRERKVVARCIPTSMQIEIIAESEGMEMVPYRGSVDLDVDGADQVDSHLNLIKGGGGALLKEKILMNSSKKNIIVAGEDKFVDVLGSNSVLVPVEVSPFARELARRRLSELGGDARERMLPKGYPYFTENGNIILDARFEPIRNPKALEIAIAALPGVVEAGIFTIKPDKVYKLLRDGGYEVLSG